MYVWSPTWLPAHLSTYLHPAVHLVIVYIVTYLVISFLVIINMYIAVILENFSQVRRSLVALTVQYNKDGYVHSFL